MTHPHKRNTDGLGRSYRAIHLINFQFLYPRKTGDISKFRSLRDGNIFERLRISIFGQKNGKYGKNAFSRI